jgi:hypothetical protein
MQNVLTFPSMQQKQAKRSFVANIRNFLRNRKIQKLIRDEQQYKEKIDFLENECYKVYLERILDYRHKAKIVDFPRFMYEERFTMCSEAIALSKEAVAFVEKVFGRKHIEKCYKLRLKEINQKLKNKK